MVFIIVNITVVASKDVAASNSFVLRGIRQRKCNSAPRPLGNLGNIAEDSEKVDSLFSARPSKGES